MPANPLRDRAVTALLALAASPATDDRRDAGAALTRFLDSESAQAVLHDLVLDEEGDVGRAVSAAVARRADPAGWVVLVLALASADARREGCIREGVGGVVGSSGTGRLQAATTALRLQEHPEAAIREGARRLLVVLGAPTG